MSPTETTSAEPSRGVHPPGENPPDGAPVEETNVEKTRGEETRGEETRGEETRADRFVRELAELKIPDPAAGRPSLWLRVGAVLMAAGAALAVAAYALSHGTRDPLVQRDAITLGLGGVTAAVAGSALFLRYSLTGFLRFWMARQSYDLARLADRLPDKEDVRP
ncbi:hypothetical protein [Actinomadura opuntiae]|uniref:hypothetical protein n=1 Tax=Actinomadura sp. OS1-43 TaxID=604315 RepID=UPI00255AF882|nr:hypothetical protein [Actinomadura sp. OS1-43]MDL4816348.1 hypothetical protein [Actinomadura sp. OS1-43]